MTVDMPGVVVDDVSTNLRELEKPLFKAHKVLPRKRDIVDNIPPIYIPKLTQPATDHPHGSTPISAPIPPLTPPGQILDRFDTNITDAQKLPSPALYHSALGAITCPHQFSPPTPDITPPRIKPLIHKPQLNSHVQPSMSSTTESFKTAREAFSSDDETNGHDHSIHSLSQPGRQKHSLKRSPVTGHEVPPLSRRTAPHAENAHPKHLPGFDSFDGVWADRLEVECATSASESKRSSGGPHLGVQLKQHMSDAIDVGYQKLNPLSPGEKTLQDPGQALQDDTISSLGERLGPTLDWRSVEDRLRVKEPVNPWRRSGGSITSIIEVVVIDSLPQVKRALRHAEKRSSLRSASSPIPQSTHVTMELNVDSQPRLVHKTARITNGDRRSVSSEISLAASATHVPPNQQLEIIPVVVIPERRSSLKSSASSSRNHSLTLSQGSYRRPITAPTYRRGSIDILGRARRAVSDSHTFTSRPDNRGIRGRGYGPPAVPPRSSSLSAPTSRDNSRTTSLTSESLRRHTEAMDMVMRTHNKDQIDPKPRTAQEFSHFHHKEEPENRSCHEAGDIHYLSPTSLHFNQPSVVSSSPGPIEISEATAVSLFAHNNTSLLLVDQRTPPESRAIQPENPRTPDGSPSRTLNDVDSPLRNPRPPPKPPAFEIIPPTPMSELGCELGATENSRESGSHFVRRFGSVRRALNARRGSDSLPTLAWSSGTRAARNRKAGKAIDSKLHPFWRPRGFWDDFADSDDEQHASSEDTNDPCYCVKQSNDSIIDDSPSVPQKRMILNGTLLGGHPPEARKKPLLDRRLLPNQGRFAHAHRPASEIFRPRSPHKHIRLTSRFGSQLGLIHPRVLHKHLKRVRQQRQEERREARREKLKQSIGERFLIDPNLAAEYHKPSKRVVT